MRNDSVIMIDEQPPVVVLWLKPEKKRHFDTP